MSVNEKLDDCDICGERKGQYRVTKRAPFNEFVLCTRCFKESHPVELFK